MTGCQARYFTATPGSRGWPAYRVRRQRGAAEAGETHMDVKNGRRGDLMILGALALAHLLLQIWSIFEYGYFRDELYYLASTDHLGRGYVEHPPFSIAV